MLILVGKLNLLSLVTFPSVSQILSLLMNPNHITFQRNYIPTMDSLFQNFISKMKTYTIFCRHKEGNDKTGKGERTGDYK